MTPLQAIFHVVARNRLTTLIFHRVLREQDAIFPDEMYAARFNETLGWIKSWFNVLPLDIAVDALRQGNLPPRAAAITFDDGYADNCTQALPILQKHGLPATFFIATGFLDGGRMWNDTIIEAVRLCEAAELDLSRLQLGVHQIATPLEKRTAIQAIVDAVKYQLPAERLETAAGVAEASGAALPENLMMTSSQVREMSDSGMQIGAHTVSHPILACTDVTTARAEISSSKGTLEELLNSPIRLFAYPNGKPGQDYLPEHVALVREAGFSAAVSTAWGVGSPTTDPFQLPRFTPWDANRLKFAMRLIGNMR